mgnify:CR=1 FL=1
MAVVVKNEKMKNDLYKEINSANDVYLTKTKIAVRQVRSDSKGRICSDTTRYFPKTKENLSCAGKMLGHIRNGRY